MPSGQRESSSSSPESIRAVIVRPASLACGMPAWTNPELTLADPVASTGWQVQGGLRFSSPILGTCRPFRAKAGQGRCARIPRRCRVSRNGASRISDGRTALMLGFVAAILFAIAFLIKPAT